jgi:hypothetical protein
MSRRSHHREYSFIWDLIDFWAVTVRQLRTTVGDAIPPTAH